MGRCYGITVLLCFLLWVCGHPAYSQIVVKESAVKISFTLGDTKFSAPPVIDVFVRDSVTSEFLPDVVIAIAREKDTSRFVTNQMGLVSFSNRYMKDSVLVTASLIGYKTLSLKTSLDKPSMEIDIRMAEDVEELNAIIVEANAVLMVARGDTTVYNVDMLKMMEGDDLARLLQKLPGVSVEDNSVFAGGRPVNKILINGSALFGSNIEAALSLIESSMIQKIRVYDEHPQDRIAESDTLGKKDHVIDVVTKEKLTEVQQTKIDAAIGLFTDKDYNGRNNIIAGTSADYKRFKKDSPEITASAGIGKNDNIMTSEPLEKIFAAASLSHSRRFRDRYSSRLFFNLNRTGSNSFLKDEYLNMDRVDENLSKKTVTGMEAGYSGIYDFKAGDRNVFHLSGMLDFKMDRYVVQESAEMKSNGSIYGSDMSDDSRNKTLSADVSLNYRHRFAKKSRELPVNESRPCTFPWGARHLVDTLQSASYPQWMTDGVGFSGFSPSLDVRFREPLARGLSLTVGAAGRGMLSRDSRCSFDRMLLSESSVRSYDYVQNNISGNVNASLSYHKNEFYVRVGVQADVIDQILQDQRGNADNLNKIYFLISPVFRMEWEKSLFTAKLSYEEAGWSPSANMLRNSLDYTNPLVLYAGNPELRLPVERTAKFSLSTTSFSIGTVWDLSVSYTHIHNLVGNNTEYFDSNVYLEDYDYEAVAGSRLVRPENIGNGWKLNASISAGFTVNPIKSNFTVNLGTLIARTPFMTGGVFNMNGTDELNTMFIYNSSFSNVFNFSASLDYTFGLNTLNSAKVYSYSRINTGVNPRFMLFKHWNISVAYNLYAMVTDRIDTGYLTNRLDFSSGYMFGKSVKYEIALNVSDILNSNNRRSVDVNELYVRSTVHSFLGRGVSVRFSVKFR